MSSCLIVKKNNAQNWEESKKEFEEACEIMGGNILDFTLGDKEGFFANFSDTEDMNAFLAVCSYLTKKRERQASSGSHPKEGSKDEGSDSNHPEKERCEWCGKVHPDQLRRAPSSRE